MTVGQASFEQIPILDPMNFMSSTKHFDWARWRPDDPTKCDFFTPIRAFQGSVRTTLNHSLALMNSVIHSWTAWLHWMGDCTHDGWSAVLQMMTHQLGAEELWCPSNTFHSTGSFGWPKPNRLISSVQSFVHLFEWSVNGSPSHIIIYGSGSPSHGSPWSSPPLERPESLQRPWVPPYTPPATTHGDVDGVCSWQKAVFPTIPREGAIHFPLAREGSTRSLGWPVGGFRFSKEAHEETKMGPEPIMCRSLGQSSAPRISVFPRTETRLGREVWAPSAVAEAPLPPAAASPSRAVEAVERCATISGRFLRRRGDFSLRGLGSEVRPGISSFEFTPRPMGVAFDRSRPMEAKPMGQSDLVVSGFGSKTDSIQTSAWRSEGRWFQSDLGLWGSQVIPKDCWGPDGTGFPDFLRGGSTNFYLLGSISYLLLGLSLVWRHPIAIPFAGEGSEPPAGPSTSFAHLGLPPKSLRIVTGPTLQFF